jgi:N-acetylglucosamine kinase-like BadF-type ATPase
VGIDGGGTATRALLSDASGRLLGEGLAGSANRNHFPRETVRTHLHAALRSAMKDRPDAAGCLSAVFLGLGGVSTESDREDIASLLRELPETAGALIRVENDTRVGLAGGLSGRPGIVLIAGTGSACLGVNARGESWFCGGWGAIADDAGSGYWIGLRAVQAAVRAEDGRLAPTALREAVYSFLGLEEPRQLLDRIHNRGMERDEVARLAPRVIEIARGGDDAAAKILEEAAGELSALVAVTARKLFGTDPFELVFVGGLARSGPPFEPMLAARIRAVSHRAVLREPEMTPVQGAVLEALRAGGVAAAPEVLSNIRKGVCSR